MDGQQLVTLGPAPAHIKLDGGLRLNAATQSGIQASFAVLKIRNKVFRIRYRGEERILQASAGTGHDGRPLPVAPVTSLDVIVVGASQAISKRFYAGGFVEGETGRAPDCFSINGISPDPASSDKQNTMCATCPQNIWGSATTQEGRKAKACNDRRRLAVVPAYDAANDEDGGAMLLDIPPASLKILDNYTRKIASTHGADVSQVVTRIGFNPAKTLELTFQAVGWVPDGREYAIAAEHGKSDQVRRMLYEEVIEVTSDEPEAETESVLGPRPAHLQSPAKMVQVQAPEPEDEEDEEEVQAPVVQVIAPQPAARKAAAKPAVTTVIKGAPPDIESQIDNILGEA